MFSADVPRTHPPTDRPPYPTYWRPRPPWVTLLVRVEDDHILVNDTGAGPHPYLLPGGAVQADSTLIETARHLLSGEAEGLPIEREVARDHWTMFRRHGTVHVFATHTMSRTTAELLRPHDGRLLPRVLPLSEALPKLPDRARARAAVGLLALEAGRTAHFDQGVLVGLHSHGSE